ncbi:hypothetical protein D6D12_07906 [Aureobasidium pullulans]|uniref:Zn(2)-C6 fungal-type domain-containing protein n=1 Tax=Aureobasidium pullulans TaxID=5580 RepID=A0AB74JL13_AURPU|nr:hypothetical protein D6D12_07906 [Aureobasidium pullulans]THX65787.1 hypothetical protein D6D11_00209 [Aureobasidium pullulans]
MEPICDSMARAISDFTFAGAPPASFDSSVCLPPTDAPQRGSLSDSQGVRQEQQRRPQTRSKNGCWTCRKRRVKCDEVRPQCSGCVRLYKNCHYGYQWQLLDFGLCTGRQLRHNTPSSSSSWNRYPSSLTSDTQSTRPSFKNRNVSDISPEDTHRKKDAPSPQDSYSISTSSSFSSSSSCRPLTPLSHVTSPGEDDQDKHVHISDLGILAKPETLSQSTLLLPLAGWNKCELPESALPGRIPSLLHNPEDQNTLVAAILVLNHRALSLPQIATYGLRYHDEELGAFDEEAAIFTHSKSFEPLRHAIRALSSLTSALRGQKPGLVEAFEHYDRAVSTSVSHAHVEPSLLYHLHFVLLIFDVCCMGQDIRGPSMWSQHLGHLATLASCLRKDNSAKVPANLLWIVLNLDVQLCLAGNNDAGSFVRAYLAEESFLPDLAELQDLRHDFGCGTSILCAAVYDLATYIYRKFAELSQLALKMRCEKDSGRGSAAARHRCIDKFYHILYIEWTFRYKHILTLTTSNRNVLMSTTTSTTLEHALLQYSTIVVYLHTSMYHDQHFPSPRVGKRVAEHCTKILSIASKNRLDPHQCIFPLFLSGYASKHMLQKEQALELIKSTWATSLNSDSCRLVNLLQLIYAQQTAQAQTSATTGVDWVAMSRQMGSQMVGLSL